MIRLENDAGLSRGSDLSERRTTRGARVEEVNVFGRFP